MKNNLILFIAAAGCGVVAMVVAFIYLQQQQVETAEVDPGMGIAVASRDLSAGDTLDVQQDLRTMQVPSRFARLGTLGVNPEHSASLEGRTINRPILEGTPLMYADLVPLVDLEVREGRMAMAVPVSGADGLDGLLVPDDYVKLFVTRQKPAENPAGAAGGTGAPDELQPGETPEQILTQLLGQELAAERGEWEAQLVSPQPLRVLAVGANLTGSRQQIGAQAAGQRRQPGLRYNSVTLEVTEEQARRILEMSSGGRARMTFVLAARPDDAPPRPDEIPDF